MSSDEINIFKRALTRERAARKQAEKILEEKSAELFSITDQLKQSNTKLEKLVKEKTSQLEGIFENIIDAYVVMDLEGNVLKMNEAAEDLFGYQMVNNDLNVVSLIYRADLEYAMTSYHELNEKGFFTDYQARIFTKDRKVKWVQINASLVYDEQNNPIAAQGIVRDITKEKEAEVQLIESENRLSTLISNLDTGVLLEDENRKISLVNKKFCELFSIPVDPEMLVGQDCSNAAEETKHMFMDPEGFANQIEKILTDRVMVLKTELTMVNGKILERDYIPIFVDREHKGHLWAYRDVTLTKRYRKSLEDQKEKYSNIIANMNLGLLEVSNEDEILMVNRGFEAMSGYLEHELLGKKGKDTLLKKGSEAAILEANEGRLKGKSNSYEVVVLTKLGEERTWLISGAPNYNINGEVIGSIGIHLDITELKNLERQKEVLLQRLEKSNDELEEYAHVVSHDLKSPLRTIYALVEWIKEDNLQKLDSESLRNLSLIETTLEKMEHLISDVLAYSTINSEDLKNESVDLNHTIKEVCELVIIPKHISVKVKRKLPIVKADNIRMRQIFQNLIGNAVRYIDKERGLIEIDVKRKDGNYIFSLKDNGIGIKEEYHHKIFKMFQSLDTERDSSGIGLSIVKKIVVSYGGSLWLESKEGEGTTFYFTLPKKNES